MIVFILILLLIKLRIPTLTHNALTTHSRTPFTYNREHSTREKSKEAMFSDSDKFCFKEVTTAHGKSHITPVHYRELGKKEGELYNSSWSDVTIYGVPLEMTFKFQDDISRLQGEKDEQEQGFIMVNSRLSQPLILEEIEDKRWAKRLERLYPMKSHKRKKKRKNMEHYPVKPKSKKEVRDEKIYSSSDKFQEITDEKRGIEKSLDYTIYIQKKGDYKIYKELKLRTPSNPWWPHEYNVYKIPIRTKYCPPLHWLEPKVQWEKIWTHVDELKTGKKRDYHYTPDESGYGPCIYFYEDHYKSNWEKDYMNIQLYFNDPYTDYYDPFSD